MDRRYPGNRRFEAIARNRHVISSSSEPTFVPCSRFVQSPVRFRGVLAMAPFLARTSSPSASIRPRGLSYKIGYARQFGLLPSANILLRGAIAEIPQCASIGRYFMLPYWSAALTPLEDTDSLRPSTGGNELSRAPQGALVL